MCTAGNCLNDFMAIWLSPLSLRRESTPSRGIRNLDRTNLDILWQQSMTEDRSVDCGYCFQPSHKSFTSGQANSIEVLPKRNRIFPRRVQENP